MKRLARHLRTTEGQAWSMTIGLVFATAMLVLGLPPVLRGQPTAATPTAATSTEVAVSTPQRADTPTTSLPIPVENRSPSPFNPPPISALPDPDVERLKQPSRDRPSAGPSAPIPAATAPERSKQPLTVRDGTWTTATTGGSVHEGNLPVSATVGLPDERSFVRLHGNTALLTLQEVADQGANILPAQALIRACRITESGWSVEAGAPAEESPAFDATRCVDGIRSDDGRWTFDLGSFTAAQRTDDAGFALVPGDGTRTFQIHFDRS